MNVAGHILLFMPIIHLLKWIPLVGYFLGGVMFFAVAIFSLIWGTMLHLFVIALAWIAYRPLMALLLFACIGAGIGLLFI